MYAIIRKSKGGYYTSMVFGFYTQITAKDEYKRYLESFQSRFFIVLNEEKTKLIKQPTFRPKTRKIDLLVLITDPDQSDWVLDEEECGCVQFLDSSKLLSLVEQDAVPPDDLAKCIEADRSYSYVEYVDVASENDLNNLSCIAGDFHDGYIAEYKHENDTLYLLFKGIWGCSIELWFKDEVSFDFGSKKDDEYDPYWSDSTLIQHNGFVYLIDECEMNPDHIPDGYCWIKAKNLRYHVIPQ